MASPSPSKQVRYAVVGLGYIAQAAVLPAFAHARKNSVLKAIVSGNATKLAGVGDKYNVPVRVSYDDLEVALAGVDAVYIATPNTMHAEQAIRAARQGVHVLCEKPLAVTEEDCRKMIETCRLANVKLMTAYRLHFEPLTLEMLESIRSGRIGRVRFLSSAFAMQAAPGGIRTRPETGGGTLFDLGIYCINAARMILGDEPDAVTAIGFDGASERMPGVDHTTTALLRYPGERLASFTSSFVSADLASLHIVGTEGHIHMDPAYEYASPLQYTVTVDDKTTKHRGRKRDQFAAELLYFSDCILKNKDPEPSGEEGARDVRIVNALYESSRSGETVKLPTLPPEPWPEPSQAINRPPVRQMPELIAAEKPHS